MSVLTYEDGKMHERIAVKGAYRTTCQKGDIVQMPDGIIGVIDTLKLIFPLGEIIHVHPSVGLFQHFLLSITRKMWFEGPEINHLKLLRTAPRT